MSPERVLEASMCHVCAACKPAVAARRLGQGQGGGAGARPCLARLTFAAWWSIAKAISDQFRMQSGSRIWVLRGRERAWAVFTRSAVAVQTKRCTRRPLSLWSLEPGSCETRQRRMRGEFPNLNTSCPHEQREGAGVAGTAREQHRAEIEIGVIGRGGRRK